MTKIANRKEENYEKVINKHLGLMDLV